MESKEVVRLAAVIGRQFKTQLVDEVFNGKKDTRNSIQILENQNLIRHVVPDVEFEFRHALTQRIAYDNLLIQQRKRLHGLVAQSIELLYENLDEHIDVLAFHYQASDSAEKAVHYLELAGDRATRLYSVQIADAHYLGALQALRRLDSAPERDRRFLEIALKWAPFAHKSPSTEKIEIITEAAELAEKMNDGPVRVQILYWVGMMQNYGGHHAAAQDSYSRSIQLGERIGRTDLIIKPTNQLARSCYFAGEFKSGLAHLEKAIRLSEQRGQAIELALSYGYLGLNQSCLGQFDLAEESITEAYTSAGRARDLVFIATLDLLSAVTQLRQGNWEEASERAGRGEFVSRKIGLPTVLIAALAVDGQSAYMLGDKNKGLLRMSEAFDLAASSGARMIVAAYYGIFAEMLALSGDLAKAQKIGDDGLRFFDETKMNVGRGETLRALAVVSHLKGALARAKSRFAESLEHSRARHARPEHAITLFRKAVLEASESSLEKNEDFKLASQLFSEMNMTGWLNEMHMARSAR
jgi:tetratricopeptide (TPR) repeat protein